MSDFDNFLSSLSDEQKQKLLAALTVKAVEPEPEPPKQNRTNKPSTQSVTVDENFIVKKTDTTNSRRREPVRGRFKNEWTDNGDISRDIETPHFEKTPRHREASKKVDLDCHVCGKSFKADPKFVYGEYHRCNRCTGK